MNEYFLLNAFRDHLNSFMMHNEYEGGRIFPHDSTLIGTKVMSKLSWVIEHCDVILEREDNIDRLESHEFCSDEKPLIFWTVTMYPSGMNQNDSGMVSFVLRSHGCSGAIDQQFLDFEISLWQGDKEIKMGKLTNNQGNKDGRYKLNILKNQIVECINRDGSLRLTCEVEHAKIEPENCGGHRGKTVTADSRNTPSNDMVKNMFERELYTDCAFRIGRREILAHRAVLVQHSDVFKRMFDQHQMIESLNREILITDTSYEVVHAMLAYIYSGETMEIRSIEREVLIIAEKYGLLSLKDYCENRLKQAIEVKNVLDLTDLAYYHNAASLDEACKYFMFVRHADILKSEEWMVESKKTNCDPYARNIFVEIIKFKIRPVEGSVAYNAVQENDALLEACTLKVEKTENELPGVLNKKFTIIPANPPFKPTRPVLP